MDRRTFIRVGALGVLMPAGRASAQLRHGTPLVGVLHTAGRSELSLRVVASLVDGLRTFGYIDGKTIAFEYRWGDGKPLLLPALAAQLVKLKVDVLCAIGPAAVEAARMATSDIPIMALDLETDPVARGWAKSLARPGGNITGLFLDLPELTAKWLALLREVAPETRRVVVLWDSSTGFVQLQAARDGAARLGFELQVQEIRSIEDLADALRVAANGKPNGMIILGSPIFRSSSSEIAAFAIGHRLPATSPFRAFAEAGGLISYGPDLNDFYRRSAAYADKILRGAKPGDLPIERPTKFELLVNLKSAKTLGLTIPQSLLLRADEVIQ
jgi:putative tryptophan/tyrosine transport system substrate-binding protein